MKSIISKLAMSFVKIFQKEGVVTVGPARPPMVAGEHYTRYGADASPDYSNHDTDAPSDYDHHNTHTHPAVDFSGLGVFSVERNFVDDNSLIAWPDSGRWRELVLNCSIEAHLALVGDYQQYLMARSGQNDAIRGSRGMQADIDLDFMKPFSVERSEDGAATIIGWFNHEDVSEWKLTIDNETHAALIKKFQQQLQGRGGSNATCVDMVSADVDLDAMHAFSVERNKEQSKTVIGWLKNGRVSEWSLPCDEYTHQAVVAKFYRLLRKRNSEQPERFAPTSIPSLLPSAVVDFAAMVPLAVDRDNNENKTLIRYLRGGKEGSWEVYCDHHTSTLLFDNYRAYLAWRDSGTAATD